MCDLAWLRERSNECPRSAPPGYPPKCDELFQKMDTFIAEHGHRLKITGTDDLIKGLKEAQIYEFTEQSDHNLSLIHI